MGVVLSTPFIVTVRPEGGGKGACYVRECRAEQFIGILQKDTDVDLSGGQWFNGCCFSFGNAEIRAGRINRYALFVVGGFVHVRRMGVECIVAYR